MWFLSRTTREKDTICGVGASRLTMTRRLLSLQVRAVKLYKRLKRWQIKSGFPFSAMRILTCASVYIWATLGKYWARLHLGRWPMWEYGYDNVGVDSPITRASVWSALGRREFHDKCRMICNIFGRLCLKYDILGSRPCIVHFAKSLRCSVTFVQGFPSRKPNPKHSSHRAL